MYLNERIFDTHRGTFFPVESYRLAHNKMLDQRVVCVGEVHNDNFHHRAELEILKVCNLHVNTYIYIYVCVCVCVSLQKKIRLFVP